MNLVTFICFGLVWAFSGVQYVTYRNTTPGRAYVAFTTFFVSTILFVIGGSAWIVSVAG